MKSIDKYLIRARKKLWPFAIVFFIPISLKCQILYEDFESWPIDGRWKWEVESIERLQIDSSTSRKGFSSLRIDLHPDDIAAGANRAEIKLFSYNYNQVGKDVWYSYSIYIPEDFIDTTYQANQHMITQWHDRPPEGYTWDNYKGHVPSINMVYRYEYEDSTSFIVLNYGNVYHEYDTLPDGSRPVKLDNQQKVSGFEVQKGEWIDLLFHIKWSFYDDGYLEVWKDGQPLTPFNGRDYKIYKANVYNSSPSYFKFGLYRNSGFESVNSINIDEFKFGTSRKETAQEDYFYFDTIRVEVPDTVQVFDTIRVEVPDTIRVEVPDTVQVEVLDTIQVFDTVRIEIVAYDTITHLIYDSCSVALSNSPSRSELRIYPNPADDFLHIEGSEEMKIYKVSIFSMSGADILNVSGSGRSFVLDISRLDSGIYFCVTEVLYRNEKFKYLDKVLKK